MNQPHEKMYVGYEPTALAESSNAVKVRVVRVRVRIRIKVSRSRL